MRVSTKMVPEIMPYHGPELRPHFLLEKWGMRGSSVAGFFGPCEVKTENLVDWEDKLAGDFIRSKMMMHFLGEFFEGSLAEGVLYQRIFMAIAAQEISKTTGQSVTRSGDDLFWKEKKLSVSIVTASPVSRLLHVGINIDATGAPVAAAGLQDLGVVQAQDLGVVQAQDLGVVQAQDLAPARALGERILGLFAKESEEIEWACSKVRPVV